MVFSLPFRPVQPVFGKGPSNSWKCHVPCEGKVHFSLKVAGSGRGRSNEGHRGAPQASAFLASAAKTSPDLAHFRLSSATKLMDVPRLTLNQFQLQRDR